ncbi:hypothetical protein KAR91_12975 [Candidatus Pacearchaeota archaeon]|nr:hypothetical protein [Candidatus Pacearchaeota archaeon]
MRGDIVRLKTYGDRLGIRYVRYCELLSFDQDGATHPCFYLFSKDDNDPDLDYHIGFKYSNIEIIGNIHE